MPQGKITFSSKIIDVTGCGRIPCLNFVGVYPHGSIGTPSALFIRDSCVEAVTRFCTTERTLPKALIWDMAEFTYTWGDGMSMVFQKPLRHFINFIVTTRETYSAMDTLLGPWVELFKPMKMPIYCESLTKAIKQTEDLVPSLQTEKSDVQCLSCGKTFLGTRLNPYTCTHCGTLQVIGYMGGRPQRLMLDNPLD
jgi:hypothetical protein